MDRNLLPAEGAKKSCPRCRTTLLFNGHYPLLAGHMALVREGPPSRDRLRYVQAWICQNGGCDYREVLDDI